MNLSMQSMQSAMDNFMFQMLGGYQDQYMDNDEIMEIYDQACMENKIV